MTDTATDTVADTQDSIYNINVEETGPATKKVSIEIPEDRIKQTLARQFNDVKREAAIPGFRPGKAPRQLVERRFGSSIKEEVRRQLISESYQQAIEKNNLKPLGEPEFDNPDDIKLPDNGAMSYSFVVEVQPEFQLPDMANCTVKKVKLSVTDENVDQAMKNLTQQQGTLVPVEDRGIEADDYVVADATLKVGDETIQDQKGVQLVVRPTRIAGIQIDDLADKLAGAKAGETRSFTVHAPADHRDEKLADKDIEVSLVISSIKRLEPAEINETFLDQLGFADEAELRQAMREQLEERINSDIQAAMRSQVQKYLLDNISFELPAKLSQRQEERTVQRRMLEMRMRGMTEEQVNQNVEQIKTGAAEEAVAELKSFFILQKVANDLNIDIDESELNGRIAMLAIQQGQRPETYKKQMQEDGSLSNLYIQMREQKAVDELIKQAKVEEVEPEAAK